MKVEIGDELTSILDGVEHIFIVTSLINTPPNYAYLHEKRGTPNYECMHWTLHFDEIGPGLKVWPTPEHNA